MKQNSYEDVIRIFANLQNEDVPYTRKEILCLLAEEIDGFYNKSFWRFAERFDALDEDRSCESFALAFMTEYNNEIRKRY